MGCHGLAGGSPVACHGLAGLPGLRSLPWAQRGNVPSSPALSVCLPARRPSARQPAIMRAAAQFPVISLQNAFKYASNLLFQIFFLTKCQICAKPRPKPRKKTPADNLRLRFFQQSTIGGREISRTGTANAPRSPPELAPLARRGTPMASPWRTSVSVTLGCRHSRRGRAGHGPAMGLAMG